MSVKLNEAVSEIVADAIKWLQEEKDVKFGKRKLAQLLVGSSNRTALNLDFHHCPLWGELAFLSVRKVEKLISSLLEQGFLISSESPKLGLSVLNLSEDSGDLSVDIISMFKSKSILALDQVDRGLFEILSKKRKEIARINKYADRPHWVCSDRFLIEICINRPKNITEIKKIKGANENHVPHLLKAFKGYNNSSSL